jgi:hypothetical protein
MKGSFKNFEQQTVKHALSLLRRIINFGVQNPLGRLCWLLWHSTPPFRKPDMVPSVVGMAFFEEQEYFLDFFPNGALHSHRAALQCWVLAPL